MKIYNLDTANKDLFLGKDDNNREIYIFDLNNVQFINDLYYPNVLAFSQKESKIYNPIREKIMSLKNLSNKSTYDGEIQKTKNIYENPVFYFIYNTDNYYHFIYDTLPYLISFQYLKQKYSNLKLLMNYPNHQKNNFYKFVDEFLEIVGIKNEDILIVNKETLYKKVYISSSYTHDIDSNLPPRQEIYSFYNSIVENIKQKHGNQELPSNIYISRRTWMHNDLSNIGTNYTTRRKLINENELVDILQKKGYTEIFTENLSTIEKVLLFNNAKNIIAPIGGGVCNALFCNNKVNINILVSPTFLDINNRFIYLFKDLNVNYNHQSEHIEKNEFKKYMRVKYGNIIGEIEDINNNELLINYTDTNVAGWNNQNQYKTISINQKLCQKLDEGLNSEWILDLNSII